MSKQTVKDKVADFLRRAFKAKDEAEVMKLADEAAAEMAKDAESEKEKTGDTHVHIHAGGEAEAPAPGAGGAPAARDDEALNARLDALEQQHAAMKAMLEEIASKLSGGGTGAEDDEEKKKAEEQAAMDKEAKEVADEVKAEVPKEKADDAVKAKDSAYLGDSFQEVCAGAEILAPGIRIWTAVSKGRDLSGS